jgi:hypothetical protein
MLKSGDVAKAAFCHQAQTQNHSVIQAMVIPSRL